MTKVICVTGTPGTGKSVLAKWLAHGKMNKYLDVKKLIAKEKLNECFDREKRCWVVDTVRLNRALISEINHAKKNKVKILVIDSHLSHYLPKKYVDLCIVTKCDLKELRKRLKKRGYSKEKIQENLDCEIFDICLNEALEKKHKVKVIKTTCAG